MSIRFSTEDVLLDLKTPNRIVVWIKTIIGRKGFELGSVNYCFCSDEYIYKCNVQFLNHDTYTDIITFDRTCGRRVSGDILISVDRVRANAERMNVSFDMELHRVIIHGILHMIGFNDKTDAESKQMRQEEDSALRVLEEIGA